MGTSDYGVSVSGDETILSLTVLTSAQLSICKGRTTRLYFKFGELYDTEILSYSD